MDRVVATTELISPKAIKKASRRLAKLSVELENLWKIVTVGKEPRAPFEECLRVLKREAKFWEDILYPSLNLDLFTWRSDDGWPRLVMFTLDNPVFEISVRRFWWCGDYLSTVVENQILPRTIANCYKDVIKKLDKRAREKLNERFSFECTFKGRVPGEAKRRMSEMRKLFEEFFIVAEPKLSKLEVETKSYALIVGFDGTNFFLLAKFEIASVEAIIQV